MVKVKRFMYRILVLSLIVFISACSAKLEKPIDVVLENNPKTHIVRQNIENFVGQRVRWGGMIASVINEKDRTQIEIVSRVLDGTGRPESSDQSTGRFIAKINGFLDPMVFSKGREITVVGTVNGKVIKNIDKFEYLYPEVIVEVFKLWPPTEKQVPYYDPFWYDPWYMRHYGPPFYPWYF